MAGGRRREILDIIYGHYKEALEVLPLEHIPALASHLLDAGVCFGFADPVTNIIANTVRLVPEENGEPDPTRAKKRKRTTETQTEALSSGAGAREEVLSKVAARDGFSPPEARTIAERSLKGLTIFLTTYFRHLPTQEALRYLHLAGADLLVAVRLVELDRCCLRRKDRFRTDSHATKVAINCASLSAGLHTIDPFLCDVSGFLSHLKWITRTVAAAESRHHLSIQHVYFLSGLLKKPLEFRKSDNPMDIAVLRIPDQGTASIKEVSVELTESLRAVLIDRVHDLYLRAISRLPMEELRTRHHRGLLKAGYCYGPFNPICNIIVNTIWYNTTFPATEEFEVDMISTTRHLESQSVKGLIAFLSAYIPEVSKHEAMVYLQKSDLNLRRAIEMANQEHGTSGSVESGYKAAVNASLHPKSEEFLKVVMHTFPTVSSAVKSVMKASHLISSGNVIRLSRLLATSPNILEPSLKLTEDAMNMLSKNKKDFITEQIIVQAKVEAVLHKYEQAKEYWYELGVICGLNNAVGKKTNIVTCKRQYSHVNFWATRTNEERPTLFFAQFSNDEDSANIHSICYPIPGLSTHNVRCCYCESEGIRIVHPTLVYWDGGSEFEKISCGKHKITNEGIISSLKLMDNSIDGFVDIKQQYMYLDLTWDCKLIPSINNNAWMATLTWEEQIREALAGNYSKPNEDRDI